jgi:hypothetical protein
MTVYDFNTPAEVDASASPTLPSRRSSRARALLSRALCNVSVFTLLLALALAPLALRLYLIVR